LVTEITTLKISFCPISRVQNATVQSNRP
jgi:hypothetical protein